MPTDPAIKAALEKAGMAAKRATPRCDYEAMAFPCCPGCDCQRATAAAVAAFLRAPGVLRAISEDGIDAVADDVERAAREAGDA